MLNLMEQEVKWNESRASIDLAMFETFGTTITLRSTAVDVNGCEKDAPLLSGKTRTFEFFFACCWSRIRHKQKNIEQDIYSVLLLYSIIDRICSSIFF